MLFDDAEKRSMESAQPHKTTERALVAGEDYYLEGSVLVFTAAYHQRRGYCCKNGCRHCPYKPIDVVKVESDGV